MTMDTIDTLPLTALRESPFNPRKSYPEAELQELAESIRSQGVMQPVVVRIHPEELNADMHYEYEIVFGHRRARAAALANLDRVPCLIRTMTDEQAAIAQVHENMKRTDVSALEEADSYEHLRQTHKMAAEVIAAAVGKTKAYVYARLKLAAAAPEVRAAVATQGLSPEIALKIARLAKPELQRMALPKLRDTYSQTTENPIVWLSVRSANSAISRMFSTNLDDAPFDPTNTKLAKVAGACTTCPRRAGNCEGLEDLLEANICTDTSCYDVKVKEHRRLEIAALTKAGHRVIDGDEARDYVPHRWQTPKGFTEIDDVIGSDGEGEDLEPVRLKDALQEMGKKAPKTTVIVDPEGELRYFLTDEQATQVAEAAGFSDDSESSTPSTAGASSRMGQGVAYESPAHHAADHDWRAIMRSCCDVAAARAARTTFELRLVAHALLFEMDVPRAVALHMGWVADLELVESDDGDASDWAHGRIDEMTPDQLGKFCVLMALDNSPYKWGRDGIPHKLAIAAHFDVDPENPRRSVEAGSAGNDQTDEPADAGVARDPNTSDMFLAEAVE
jgi:ParB/RepB/Spo0J family partition protein